ncbi:hypothetical protein PFISCL1PPCAC_21752, partial [Pristionchus fissidentatus]
YVCDCGHKGVSVNHAVKSQCKLLNFKIIYEKVEGVKCILCESRPSTIGGYAAHLTLHDSSLSE